MQAIGTSFWVVLIVLGAFASASRTVAASQAGAADEADAASAADGESTKFGDASLRNLAVGRSMDGTTILAVLHPAALDHRGKRTRVLLVGFSENAATIIRRTLRRFYEEPKDTERRRRFLLSAVPNARPGESKRKATSFPPNGDAYRQADGGESAYLWRWIGMQAPDLVVVVEPSPAGTTWFVPPKSLPSLDQLAKKLEPKQPTSEGELAAALAVSAACETGVIPALRVRADHAEFLEPLLSAWNSTLGASPARREIQRRLSRSPREVARQLSRHYGRDLKQVVYIPALALVGRLRLGALDGDASQRDDVEKIVEAYLQSHPEPRINNGSALSGHLLFTELASNSTGPSRQRWIRLSRRAADMAFDDSGDVRGSMPFHNEMSDALFMGGPILAHVGALTGDRRYFEACMAHLRFMRGLDLRSDGLYRHSPLDEAAWGRGNGFPALGVAWCLSHWPEARSDFAELKSMLQHHLATLGKHQDPTGCWHQIVDHSDSYREFTSTCMITYAMARGVRSGWLASDEFDPLIRRGWYAIRTRVAANGRLVDVCTGTGKQRSLKDYYLRKAILGSDPRGGAMALMAATEMDAYFAETATSEKRP